MVYCDSLNGENIFAKYFDERKTAMPMFNAVGLIDNSLIVRFGDSL